MSWTDKEEEYLRKIHYQSNIYYQYYNRKTLHYTKLSQKYNIPILIISAINSLVAISMPQFMPQSYVSILNGILSLGTGILGSIQLFLKINERMGNCIAVSMMFQKLYLKIGKELSIERELRNSDGKTFLSECFNEFNQAIDKSTPIDKHIKNYLILPNGDVSTELPTIIPTKSFRDLDIDGSDIDIENNNSTPKSPSSTTTPFHTTITTTTHPITTTIDDSIQLSTQVRKSF